MVVIVKSVGIHKMGILKPKLCHALIHHLHKLVHTSRHMIGCYQTHFIGRLEHDAIKHLLDRELLPRHTVHRGAAGLNAVGFRLCKSDHITR